MNRIKFDAKILDLYSIDYDYFQDSVENEVSKLLRQAIANPGAAGIIKGFKLKISPTDSSKVMIYSDGTWNSAFSNDGIMVEIENDIDLIAPVTAGVLNYIYVRSYTVDGTYNKTAGVIEEGVQKAIDYYDYARVYDRRLDAWAIDVYTQAEYLNLTEAERYALIYVGSFLATTPVTAISTSGRSNMETFIADGSVTTDSISTTDMLLPQIYVDNSAEIIDTYPVAFEPENLEEDLNKIRSIMRSVRGTAIWDEYDTNNLRVFDSAISALHSDGVFENILNDELDVIPNSTGLSVIVTSGKALTNGVLQSITDLSRQTKNIEPQPSYLITTEDHAIGVLPLEGTYVILDYQNVSVSSVYGNFGGGYLGISGIDYITYSSTGSLFIPYTTNFNPAYDIYVTYYYGFMRYDVIAIGPDLTVQVAQGVSATSTGTIPNVPIPPDVPIIDTGYVPLAVIKVVPNISRFEYNHINFYKRYTPWVRDIVFIPCYDTTNIPTSVNRITYHKANTTIDEFNLNWTSSTYDDMTYYQSTTANTSITTAVMCAEDDEVWILVDKSIESNSITIEWNSLATSTGYDSNIPLDLQWRYPLHYYPIKVTKGLSTGIHKFKITKLGSNSFKFYGILVGKSDTFYHNYSQTEIETYFNRFLAEDTSTNNIAIGLDNLASGIAGFGNIAIGYQALKYNTTDNNIAIGHQALDANTLGIRNIGIGTSALSENLIGGYNTAIGHNALLLNTANHNSAIGYQALTVNTTGANNTAIGRQALLSNISGKENTAIGAFALVTNTTGSNNIAIGYYSGSSVVSANNVITIGANVAGSNTSNSIFIGSNLSGASTRIGNIYSDGNITAAPNVVVGADGRLQRTTYGGSSYGERGVPVGSIIAWLPGGFNIGGAIAGYAQVTGIYTSLTSTPWWKECDGSQITVPGGVGGITDLNGRYTPNLTNDIFLMGGGGVGAVTIGTPGGSNNVSAHAVTNPNHVHLLGYSYIGTSVRTISFYAADGATLLTTLDTAKAGAVGFIAGTLVVNDGYFYSASSGETTCSVTNNHGLNTNRPRYLAVKYIMRIY